MGVIAYPWDDSMTVVVEGDSSDAEATYGPSGQCGDAHGPEDIFLFTLPRVVKTVSVTLETLPNPGSWDSHLYVVNDVCGATTLGCLDEFSTEQPEIVIINNPSSTSISIVADGFASDDKGPYRIAVTVDECDANDDCASSEFCHNSSTDHSRCKVQN